LRWWTGASRGIGRVIAQQLAHRGVRVALHYRKQSQGGGRNLAGLAGAGHASFAADLSTRRRRATCGSGSPILSAPSIF